MILSLLIGCLCLNALIAGIDIWTVKPLHIINLFGAIAPAFALGMMRKF